MKKAYCESSRLFGCVGTCSRKSENSFSPHGRACILNSKRVQRYGLKNFHLGSFCHTYGMWPPFRILVPFPAKEKSRCICIDFLWQGHKDSNSGHAVLETAALPAELYPYEQYLDIIACFFWFCNTFLNKFQIFSKFCLFVYIFETSSWYKFPFVL